MKNVCFFLLMYASSLVAQDANFMVTLGTDSLLMGNYMEVTFTLKDATGQSFEAPEFEGFNMVGGPNQSSSYSVINGQVSQEISYSFYIEPADIGNYYIGPATIQVDGKMLETQPVEIIVHPNPDGIKQTPKRDNEFSIWGNPFSPSTPTPPKKTKKKRKIYKM